MVCFRLVTILPERPVLNWPRFRSCIARSIFCAAFGPYFAVDPLLGRSFHRVVDAILLPNGSRYRCGHRGASKHRDCQSIDRGQRSSSGVKWPAYRRLVIAAFVAPWRSGSP